jgi:cyclohexyl-isocyanide hydratase
MKRRQFTQLAFLGGLGAFLSSGQTGAKENSLTHFLTKEEAQMQSQQAHKAFADLKEDGFKMMGQEHIVMLLYPGFASLDLVGPQYLFASMMGVTLYLISAENDLNPITSSDGLTIVPTHTADQCPKELDVFFVPGGADGTLKAMQNPRLIKLIAEKAATAKYITSVCTGSLLLGKAGFLKGKKATSHWTTMEILPEFGAIPVKQRVVWDGRLVTGGGVTAGVDFGLEIIAALRGKSYAQAVQLEVEYDPAPPFNSGSPEKATPFIKSSIQGFFAPLVQKFRASI